MKAGDGEWGGEVKGNEAVHEFWQLEASLGRQKPLIIGCVC